MDVVALIARIAFTAIFLGAALALFALYASDAHPGLNLVGPLFP